MALSLAKKGAKKISQSPSSKPQSLIGYLRPSVVCEQRQRDAKPNSGPPLKAAEERGSGFGVWDLGF